MTVHELRISLDEVELEIWRRVQVPSAISLAQLHRVIQTIKPWQDHHLHEFTIAGVLYGIDDGESFDEPPEDERRVRLDDLATAGDAFVYTYDFGDSWDHTVAVLAVHPADPSVSYPDCLDGGRACPPEDVGGPPGYEEFLGAIADPDHEEHDSYLEWIGGVFDPEKFDVHGTNVRLGRLSLGRSATRRRR